MYDIAVIGLGPAGSNFARLVDSENLKVAVLDKKSSKCPEKNNKPCGGLLSPDAQRSLAKFNLSIPGEVIASPQIFYVKTIDIDNGITKNYQRFYININRREFDLWMISLIPETVTIFDDTTVKGIDKADGYYEITFINNGQIKSITSKYIIGADGANSIVSKSFFKRNDETYRVAIQEWFVQDDRKPFFSCVFDSKNSDSYSWSLSKDGYFIFGGAYNKKNSKKCFENQKKMFSAYGFSVSSPVKREACLVYRLRRFKDMRLGRGGAFLMGEAAGFVSPSSFEGISGALESSRILSGIFNFGKTEILKHYKKQSRKLRVKYLFKIIKADILESRFLRMIIMKSGIKSIEVKY